MKISVDSIKIDLDTKEDLRELIHKLNWNFIEPMNEGAITQVGGYINDVRPHLALLEFVRDEFKELALLRGENPDLMSQFKNIVSDLNNIQKGFEKNAIIFYKDSN